MDDSERISAMYCLLCVAYDVMMMLKQKKKTRGKHQNEVFVYVCVYFGWLLGWAGGAKPNILSNVIETCSGRFVYN